MKTNRIIRLAFPLLFLPGMLFAENGAYEKLAAKLQQYAIVYDGYKDTNYPILSGNAAIGGLTDPLGRGVYNIEMNDLYLNENSRGIGPGMMLKIAQFSGLQPETYRQTYNLENGLLTTDVGYSNGGYHSELFFSQDDKELMVYTFTNLGKNNLVCNFDLGPYEFDIVSHTDKTLYGVSKAPSFTSLHYFLQTNLPFGSYLPYSQDIFPKKDIFLTVPPGKKLEIKLRLKVEADSTPRTLTIPSETDELFKNNSRKWKENWQSMGVVILPDGEYAQTFYRSLHWLQCTAGLGSNLPGEQQFATLTSNLAEAYQYHGKAQLNRSAWEQDPFTYGAAGWSILAYTWLGDQTRAGNMLAGFYRPEALKKNVTTMFPVGKYEFEYGGKKKGSFDYLSPEPTDAIAFGHQNKFDRSNHAAPPWDTQVHIQGFAPAMYYHYHRLYGEKEDTTYAVMRGTAEFWRALLHYDAKQKTYTIAPLLSLTEDLFEADLLDALIAAKWVLTRAATFAEQRNIDSDLRKKWLHIAQNIRIKDKNDVYLEFGGDDGSRAGAGYQGIRGYAYLGFPTLESMKDFQAKKVNKSLDQCWERNKKGKGMIAFIANWFALTDAYWGRAEDAYEKSGYSVRQTEPSCSAMCEQNATMYYFLTSYASFTMVPVSMVLQSVGNEIKVFPAVPKAFADIEFYNLPATDGIRVSGVMKGGKTQKVWFEKDGKQLLEINNKDNISVRWSNKRLQVDDSGKTASLGINPLPDPSCQGIYFDKKVYTKVEIPSFEQIKPNLPQPVYDENPLWIKTWWKAWELAFQHLYEPTEGSGFVSPYFDAAFNANMFLWDGSFITMFTNYAHPMVKSIEGLDNFYAKQYANGEICREINRTTGEDYIEWVNTENKPLFTRWGYYFGQTKRQESIPFQYIGRAVPTPNPNNTLDAMNHPILAWAEWESYKITGNKNRLNLIWNPLVKYYEALQKYIRQGNGLYATDWGSMDNSSRNPWLDGGGTGIDISAEMALFARNLADMANVLGKKDQQKFYTKEANDLSALINQKMWNEKDRFYFDLNVKEEQCAIKTVAGFWPLIAQTASPQQAEKLSEHLQNPETFGRNYPVPTLSADAAGYYSDGHYWCGAVWAPTNTMVIRGLEKYGYDKLAYSIAMKHIQQVADVYQKTGTIWENYSADALSPGNPSKNDFVGWSGMAPILYLLEYAVGLKPDAASNTLTWNIQSKQTVGCRNYRFNGHTVSLIAQTKGNQTVIEIDSDSPFTLSVNINHKIVHKKVNRGHQTYSVSN